MTLREFVEQADGRIVKMFMKMGRVLPMYHCIAKGGEEVVFPMPPGRKNEALAIVRAGFELLGVTRYVFLNEAWIVETEDDAVIEQAKQYADAGGNLEDFSGRKEMLLLMAEDESEGMIVARREITRRRGRPSLGPLSIDTPDGLEGRMVGLLPKGRGKVN